METIADYLAELCKGQNLSFRRASMKAGLAPETIGKIVNRGNSSTPRPDTLRLIADRLGGDFALMMRLAGHLPPLPEPHEDIPEGAREVLEQVLALWRDIKDKDPEAVHRLALMARTQAEVVALAIRHQEERAREEVAQG